MGACAIPKSQCLCVVVVAYVPAVCERPFHAQYGICACACKCTHTSIHTSKAALVSGTSHVPVHVPLLTLIRNIRSQEKLGSWIAPPCEAQARFATKLMTWELNNYFIFTVLGSVLQRNQQDAKRQEDFF